MRYGQAQSHLKDRRTNSIEVSGAALLSVYMKLHHSDRFGLLPNDNPKSKTIYQSENAS